MIEATPQMRPVMVLEEMMLRYPDRNRGSMRRTLERRMRTWRALHGPDKTNRLNISPLFTLCK